MINITSDLARCVGLWLAEGNTKTDREITFTNNCKNLIDLFYETVINLFYERGNPRIYIYYPIEGMRKFYFDCKTNEYLDKRANKPYFIFKLASKKLFGKWEGLVERIKSEQKWYRFILQGFFAGEGNVKTGTHCSRSIRISQGEENPFLEKMLNHFCTTFKFSERGRAYVLHGRENLEKLQKIKIAKLHPLKRNLFKKMMEEYKQYHYSRGELKDKLYSALKRPRTSSELSEEFERSQDRIQRVLSELKKTNKVQNYRVRSKDYWIREDENTIIISRVKENYLKKLEELNKTSEFASNFDVCWKSSYRRLSELEKLGLVKRKENKEWEMLDNERKVIVK